MPGELGNFIPAVILHSDGKVPFGPIVDHISQGQQAPCQASSDEPTEDKAQEEDRGVEEEGGLKDGVGHFQQEVVERWEGEDKIPQAPCSVILYAEDIRGEGLVLQAGLP